MATIESPTTSKADDVEQVSIHSTGANGRRRLNFQMVQNVLLIWLDNNIDANNTDCRNTITHLRRAVNTIKTFTDGNECLEFLETMSDEKACMIISGSLGQHIVPCVHDMSQIDSIFIFCSNRKRHTSWAKDWSKIKGVFTEISPICDALKMAAQQCEQSAIPISFVATSGEISNNLNQLDSSYMYTQILKEILLTIKFEEKHMREFIDYCNVVLAENDTELNNLDKFQKRYHDKTPIWWYTYECFLYPMLNRPLRLMDVNVIIKMGFFISDLHRQIERLHSKQLTEGHFSNSFTVYRGQGMTKTDFQQMTKTKGGLLSFNNFLSTSKGYEVSLDFARRALPNSDMVGILFAMKIDSSKSTTPFSSIVNFSFYNNAENEVLFSMHTIFRIGEIKPMHENNRLFHVDLILTSDNDKDLLLLTDRIREETFPNASGWQRLGELLLKMGQFFKAQQIYETLLDQKTNDFEKAAIYHQLGRAKNNQGEYEEAIEYYEKSIKIKEKILPSNDSSLAQSYNNIGMVYDAIGEQSKALFYYEKAL